MVPNSTLGGARFAFRYRLPSVPCPMGNKSAELVCADGGKWRMFECQEKGEEGNDVFVPSRPCVVPRIRNGLVLELNRQNGTIRFRCNFGFIPLDVQLSLCQPMGQWRPEPKCSAIHCNDSPRNEMPNLAIFQPPNRYMPATIASDFLPNSAKFGTLVPFECGNGTVPRGRQTVAQCATNGKWTTVEMACQKIGCYAVNVELGNFTHFWTPPDEVAQIECVQGTKLAMNTMPKCVLDRNGTAKWDGIPPEGIKCQFENLCDNFEKNPCGSNGICIPLNGSYTCNCTTPNYQFNKSALFGEHCHEIDQCSAGLWPCSSGTCARTVSPPGRSSAFPLFQCLCPAGTHILYDQNKTNEKNLIIPSHRWLISGHSCLTKRCQRIYPMPKEQFIVHPSQPQLLVNSTLTIYCRQNANSAPVGPEAELKCLPDGRWSGTMPKQCQKVFPTCQPPVMPNKATKIWGQPFKEYAVNSVAEFFCVQWTHNGEKGSDYLLIGLSRSICLPTGNWTNDPPTCILPQCSQISLGLRSDGMRISLEKGTNWPTDEKFGPGAMVKMSCNKSGEQWTIICKRLSNFAMAWSMDELPKCEDQKAKNESDGICDMAKFKKKCADLLSPSRENVPVGHEVSFKCAQPNYILSDHKMRKCVKNSISRVIREATVDEQKEPPFVADHSAEGQLGQLIRAAKPEKDIVFESAHRLFGWQASVQWRQNPTNGSWTYWPTHRYLKSFLITPPMDVLAGDWLSLSVEIGPRPCPDCMVWVSYFAGDTPSSDPSAEHFSPLGRIVSDPIVHSIQFFPPHSKLRIQISADDKSPNFVVERIRVISTACPALNLKNFAIFPRTPTHFDNQTVSAQCQFGKTMQLVCSPSGNWLFPKNESNFGCECPTENTSKLSGGKKDALLCHVCSSETDSHCVSLTVPATDDGAHTERCASPTALCMVQSHTRSGTTRGIHRQSSEEHAVPFKIVRKCAERAECGIFKSNVSARESCLTDLDGIEKCTTCCSDDMCNGLKPRELLNGGAFVTLRPVMTTTLASSTTETTTATMTTTQSTSFLTVKNTVTSSPNTVISTRTTTPREQQASVSMTTGAHAVTIPSPQFNLPQNSDAFNLDSAPPFCIDQQPLEILCVSPLKIRRQIDSGQPEPTVIPWPTVVDNEPHIQLQSLNLNISNKAFKFRGDETEIVWRAVDLHGEVKHCVTKLIFNNATYFDNKKEILPTENLTDGMDIQCPEWHIRKVNVSAAFGGDPLTVGPPLVRAEYPPILNSHRNTLSFDPPSGTPIALGVPKLVTVSVSGVQKCQFWYQTLSIDCPLWTLGSDNWQKFECVNEINGMMRCKRRERCPGGREYPRGLRELRCWRNQPGKGITYTSETANEDEEKPLIGEAQCLQDESPSAVTVSIVVASDMAKCANELTQQINVFFSQNCPGIQWSVSTNSAADIVHTNLTVQNFTAETPNGGNGQINLTNCLQRVKVGFETAFSHKFGMPFDDQCPDGSVHSRHFSYHLQCPNGWAPNELFRCEICPKGHFSANGTCAKCPAGTFAKRAGQTKCTQCPEGTTTAEAGGVAEWQCLARCPPNTFSVNGLASCRACPNKQCQKAQEDAGQMPFNVQSQKLDVQNHFDCAFDGCSGHGKCQKSICLCDLGFVGYDCSVPFNLCDAQFCLNSAKCVFDHHNGTLCICPRGFNGKRCETVLYTDQQNESITLTIKHKNGFCNGPSSAGISANECPNGACTGGVCQCNAGFSKGSNESDQSCVPTNTFLASKSYQNGAKSCFNGPNGKVNCKCAEEWTGEFCEQQTDSCFLPQNHCQNGGTCTWNVKNLSVFSSFCLCPIGFDGNHCEKNAPAESLEQCHPQNLCGQNGNCQWDNAIGAIYCQCDNGYFGEFCEAKLNPCSSVLPNAPICYNGGTCQAIGPEKAVCKCEKGWTGAQCDKREDLCTEMQCQNGGKCIGTHYGTAYCSCADGYGGEKCQVKLNPCSKWPEGDVGICGNGKCQAKGKGHNAKFECLCIDGWTGPNCNIPSEECQKWKKCQNNGKCIPLIDGGETQQKWKCICTDGFWGEQCENVVNYCDLEGICLNNGSCESIGPNYRCKCDNKKGKFYGRNCEQLVEFCQPNPCANGGKCWPNYDDTKGFKCECGPNYVPETNCTRKLNLCEQWPNYCNGGQCQILPNTSNSPHCLCPPNSMGIRCETRKSTHYDLHFYPFLQHSSPFSQTIHSPTFPCFVLFNTPFSLCFWLRFGQMDGQTDQLFSMGSSRTVYISINSIESKRLRKATQLLHFDEFGVNFLGTKLPFDNGRPLVGQIWHHICLIYDVKVFRLFLNGHFVKEHSVDENHSTNLTTENCEILLAETEEEDRFVGQLSQVELYTQKFEDSEIFRMAWSCREWTHRQEKSFTLIEWTHFTTVDVFNKAQIALIPGICSESDCQPGRASECANGKKLKVPPTVLLCPRSQFITVPVPHQRLMQIHWEGSLERMFRPIGPSPIVRFESNFRPGQTFGWGQFHVVYLAEDAQGNWATCEFDIVVSPIKCSDLFVPGSFNKLTVHKFRIEEAKQAEKIINLKCLNTELVSNVVAKPPFYTCDRLGQWDRWATFGRPFALPSCTPTENAMQEVVGDLHFDATCDKAAEYSLQVVQTIENASRNFGSFCVRPLCDGQLGIKTECLGERSAISDAGPTATHSPAPEVPLLGDAEERARRGLIADGPQQTVRVLFDLSVNNSKRAVAPIIRDIMESKFGVNFVGESTRLQCSNAFPQLHINGDAKIAGSANSVAMALEPPLVQCASCAPGETWQQIVRKIATTTKDESVVNSDMSGNCVKCPPNTYKASPGVQQCTPCKDDRITGGVVGCMREIDCYLNCPPGSVYCSMTDLCRMCAHGQYMPYSGRLQCIGCPPGTTTEQEGSTSADQCSLRCAAGEEMGVGEQCEMCIRGTYRAEGMNACRRCSLGFTTRLNGAKFASDCSLIFCPPGHFRNTTIEADTNKFDQLNSAFEAVCVPCPIGYYQSDYGAEECVRCPVGWQTLSYGAKSVQECDQPNDGTCKPDEPEPCPEGMECVQARGQTYECHNLPNMDRNDHGDAWRRLWIPMVLALFAVFLLALLSIIFIKNRQKWLLMLNRNCPSAFFLCCKKMTVDDLASNEFTRSARPNVVTGANIRRQQHIQTEEEMAQRQMEPIAIGRKMAHKKGDDEEVHNNSTASERRKSFGSANGAQGFILRGQAASAEDTPSLKSNVEDPLNEIRSGLMEVMNANEQNDGDQSEGTDSGRLSETFGEGRQKFASINSNRRPHLTVQTNFPINGNEREPPFVRAVHNLNRDDQPSFDSARATDSIGMRILGMEQHHADDTLAQRRHRMGGLVGLRCQQFDKGISGQVPLRSSLTGRSPIAVNSLPKSGANLPAADQSAAVVPSYDDDDDAFFS